MNNRLHNSGIARLVIILFFFGVVAPCLYSGQEAKEISVQILDGESGKPIVGASFLLGLPKGDKNVNKMRFKTDSKGIAKISLSDPVPQHFSIIIGPEVELCPNVTFPMVRVLLEGIVAEDTCENSRYKYSGKPEPGSLVLFAKQVSVWQRMLREL